MPMQTQTIAYVSSISFKMFRSFDQNKYIAIKKNQKYFALCIYEPFSVSMMSSKLERQEKSELQSCFCIAISRYCRYLCELSDNDTEAYIIPPMTDGQSRVVPPSQLIRQIQKNKTFKKIKIHRQGVSAGVFKGAEFRNGLNLCSSGFSFTVFWPYFQSKVNLANSSGLNFPKKILRQHHNIGYVTCICSLAV